MKTLKDFTPEIQAKIPVYIEKALSGVFDGGRYTAFNFDGAYNCVKLQYERCGYKPPLMIVAENPYEAQIMFNYIKHHPVWSQIVVGLQDSNQFRSRLRSQLDLQLSSQLRSQLDLQIDSQLYSQIDLQLYSQLDSQLDLQLYSQLRSQLYSRLHSQLRSQLSSQLHSRLRSQLSEYNSDYLFTVNVWSPAYFAFYTFINKELGVKAEIESELEIFSTAYENSNIYSAIFSEALCVVSKFPKRVYRNTDNNLHNPSGQAVVWGHITEQTKFDCYYINGRNVPSWVFTEEITKERFLAEQNADIKGAMYEVLGQQRVMEMLGATVVDTKQLVHANGDVETVDLLKTNEVFAEIGNQPFAWARVNCPSTGTTYLLGVEPHHTCAREAIASLSMFSAEEYSFNFRS